ncbi:MAG: twin-arginine translocation signal domain-containing protein [Faecalibacterium sp.]
MILSRRSFLKVAGLSAVAVAGASMFTGCGMTISSPLLSR